MLLSILQWPLRITEDVSLCMKKKMLKKKNDNGGERTVVNHPFMRIYTYVYLK